MAEMALDKTTGVVETAAGTVEMAAGMKADALDERAAGKVGMIAGFGKKTYCFEEIGDG